MGRFFAFAEASMQAEGLRRRFLLAEAGLLDGERVTTHWYFCDRLAREYPAVTVDPEPIYIRNGRLSTSARVTAGLDLALSMIEEDLGWK